MKINCFSFQCFFLWKSVCALCSFKIPTSAKIYRSPNLNEKFEGVPALTSNIYRVFGRGSDKNFMCICQIHCNILFR